MRRWVSLALTLGILVVMVGAVLRIEIFNVLFFVFSIVAPLVVGAYMVIFNRQFTLEVRRQQNALWMRTPWKMGIPESWVPFYRVFSVIVGSGLFIGGLAFAARYLLP